MGTRPGMNDIGYYQDSRVERLPDIEYPQSGFDPNEWSVLVDANVADMNPRSWVGGTGGTEPPVEAPTFPPALDCVEITAVQGEGSFSPYQGQHVKICDVYVTSIRRSGFNVQAKERSSTAASSGIYVYLGSMPTPDLSVGKRVTLEGQVNEVSANNSRKFLLIMYYHFCSNCRMCQSMTNSVLRRNTGKVANGMQWMFVQ